MNNYIYIKKNVTPQQNSSIVVFINFILQLQWLIHSLNFSFYLTVVFKADIKRRFCAPVLGLCYAFC